MTNGFVLALVGLALVGLQLREFGGQSNGSMRTQNGQTICGDLTTWIVEPARDARPGDSRSL